MYGCRLALGRISDAVHSAIAQGCITSSRLPSPAHAGAVGAGAGFCAPVTGRTLTHGKSGTPCIATWRLVAGVRQLPTPRE